MRHVVLAIAAALVLIAVPAAAQYTQPSTTTTQPTTTTTQPSTSTTEDTTATPATTTDDMSNMAAPSTTTTNVPVQEERTNPAVPTHSPNSGLTASGSVVSWNADEVVLRTATGITHFKLLPSTTGAGSFTEGQRLTIDFDRNEMGVLLAKQIRLEGTEAPVAQGITTPGAAAAGAEVASTIDEAVSTAPVPPPPPVTTTTTTESTTTNLPATGSNAPLVGLLGLLALGGAAALRRL